MRRVAGAALLGGALLLGSVSGCGGPPPAGRVVTVAKQDLVLDVEVTGTLKSLESMNVVPVRSSQISKARVAALSIAMRRSAALLMSTSPRTESTARRPTHSSRILRRAPLPSAKRSTSVVCATASGSTPADARLV